MHKHSLIIGLILLLSASVAATHTDTPLIAAWHFNETSGDLLDHSGNDIHGTPYGIEQGVQGANNSTAYRFDGNDDWIDIPYDPALSPGSSFSLETWVRPAEFSTDWEWIFQRTVGSTYGLHIVEWDDGSHWITFPVSTDQEGYNHARYRSVGPAGEWYHIVGTYDNSSIKLYLNGQLVDERPQTGSIPVDRRRSSIGSWPEPDNFFNGSIDELILYGQALNHSEVTYHHQHPPGWQPTGTAGDQTDSTADNQTDDTTGNQTSDDSTGNSDNTPTSNETADDSLFPRGDGTTDSNTTTDNETDDAAEGGQDTTDNRTASTGTNTTENDSPDEEPSNASRTIIYSPSTNKTLILPPNEQTDLQIRPREIDTAIQAGTTSTITVTLSSQERQQVRVLTEGLEPITVPMNTTYSTGPNRTIYFPLRLSPSTPGVYGGSISIIADSSTTVPVTVHARQNTTSSMDIQTTVTEDGQTTVAVDTRISGNNTDNTIVTFLLYDPSDGSEIHRQQARYGEPSTTFSTTQDLEEGTYRITVIASIDGSRIERSTQFQTGSFNIPDEELSPASAGQPDQQPVVLLIILTALILLATGYRYRDEIQDRFPV